MTATTELDLARAAIRARAATLIRKYGWTQDDYTNPAGCICMVEAIGRASGLPPLALTISGRAAARARGDADPAAAQYAAADNTMDEIAAELGRNPLGHQTPQGYLMDWQDDSSRTVQDVLDALERRVEEPA